MRSRRKTGKAAGKLRHGAPLRPLKTHAGHADKLDLLDHLSLWGDEREAEVA